MSRLHPDAAGGNDSVTQNHDAQYITIHRERDIAESRHLPIRAYRGLSSVMSKGLRIGPGGAFGEAGCIAHVFLYEVGVDGDGRRGPWACRFLPRA
jgi:hypothetical protein